MKSKKILLILSFLFIHLTAFSQQIGAGFTSFIPDFSVPLLSGVYNGVNATGATPDNAYGGFQHLLVIRHVNTTNNHQLQIASSMESNSRLFFRKLSASSLVSQNPVWHEVATLGINNFVGNQSISGDLKIASYSPLLVLQRNTNVGGFTQGIQTKNLDNTNNWFFGNLQANSWIVSKGDYQNPKLTVLDNGNVGIGITAPAALLDLQKLYGNDVGIKLTQPGSSIWDIKNTASTGLFTIGAGGAAYFNIDKTNGYVGIGTTTPTAKLTIAGDFQSIVPSSANPINAFTVDVQSFGTSANANTSSYFRVRDIGAGNYIPFIIKGDGKVGIGTAVPDELLTVKGKIHTQEVRVDLIGYGPDYVFEKYYTGKSELKSDYVMPTLAEIENFTKKNHHLPNVPSAQEIKQNGLSLGEMSNVLLQKVEELTLYAIEQNKVIEELKVQVATLMTKKQ